MTHREDVVVVVGELLLGEKLQVLGLRVEAKAGLHLVAFFLFQRASQREERKLFRVFSFLVFFFRCTPSRGSVDTSLDRKELRSAVRSR